MRSTLLLPALAALALAAPRPQEIDLDDVIAAGKPVLVTPALDVPVQTASVVPVSQVDSSAAAAIETNPATAKRDLQHVEKRDGDCSPQPIGAGPVPSPDTASAFKSFATLQVRALSPCMEIITLMDTRRWQLMHQPQMDTPASSPTFHQP